MIAAITHGTAGCLLGLSLSSAETPVEHRAVRYQYVMNYSRRQFLSTVTTGAAAIQLSGLSLLNPLLLRKESACEHHSRTVKIAAHRGAMTECPENTLAAYQKAVEMGADLIEIDLRTSRDGELFVLHDSSLDRTTDGRGMATDLTLAELQQLDAGSWFDPVFEGAQIPSFDQVLEWAAESNAILLLDLKEQGTMYSRRITESVHHAGLEENVVVGVRSVPQAKEFRELLPITRQLAFISSPEGIREYGNAGVEVIRLWLGWLEVQPVLAEHVHETGCKLMINGTDGNREEAQRLLSFEPDWVLIDDLEQFQVSLQHISQNG